MKKLLFIYIFLLNIGLSQAATTHEDLLVAARALGFMNNSLTGKVRVGIVYAPSASKSVTDANNIYKLMGSGLEVGDVVLAPVLLNIDNAASADVRLFFLAEGSGNDAAKLGAISREKKVLCITADTSQVIKGSCTLGVKSEPKVEIFMNRGLANSSGISFATAFRMMITEL